MTVFHWKLASGMDRPTNEAWSQIREAAAAAVVNSGLVGPGGEGSLPHIGSNHIEFRTPGDPCLVFCFTRRGVTGATLDTEEHGDVARKDVFERSVDATLRAITQHAPGWIKAWQVR